MKPMNPKIRERATFRKLGDWVRSIFVMMYCRSEKSFWQFMRVRSSIFKHLHFSQNLLGSDSEIPSAEGGAFTESRE